MLSKYTVFCMAVESGNITRTAEEIGYSQSAVSQIIKSLESETGSTLVERRKSGIRLTKDGEEYMPFFQAISAAENALYEKIDNMHGLMSSVLEIGSVASISRSVLPGWMQSFRDKYPDVTFHLHQGEYEEIANWIREGRVDIGFVAAESAEGLSFRTLYHDYLMAVMPKGHPLSKKRTVSITDLADEHIVMVDEGKYNYSIQAFEEFGIDPPIDYKIYDEYTVMSLLRQGFGVSLIYDRVITGFSQGLSVRPVKEKPRRELVLAWNNWDTLSYASREFASFVIDAAKKQPA